MTRVRRNSHFTAVPNAAMRDESISIEARGLLALMMGMGSSWVYRGGDLMKRCGVGRDKYQRMVRELKDAGYLEVVPKQVDGGKLDGYDYVLHDVTGSLKNRQPAEPPGGKQGILRRTTYKKNNYKTPNPLKGADLFSENDCQAETKKPAKKDSPVEILKQIVSDETAVDFANHRKAMKRPLTAEAARRLVKKLQNHLNPDAVFDLSIENGWQGVFPEKVGGPRNAQSADESTADFARRIAERRAARRMDSGPGESASLPLLPAEHAAGPGRSGNG
ncbi:hypothetical protein [Roseovarius amoyensis]|uniref:hypothetical protein n=1 Tax=Roseovarius amoyensis TaxID=2211448 RepID=UPI0013A6B484|nr:hypothetical protein [Roseovarius amoyensis]